MPELTPAPRPRDFAYVPLDAGWRQWIAENRLRDCTPQSMLVTMTNAGLDPRELAGCEPVFLVHQPGRAESLHLRESGDQGLVKLYTV